MSKAITARQKRINATLARINESVRVELCRKRARGVDAAEAIGIRPETFSRKLHSDETGAAGWTLEELAGICDYLNLTIAEIMGV